MESGNRVLFTGNFSGINSICSVQKTYLCTSLSLYFHGKFHIRLGKIVGKYRNHRQILYMNLRYHIQINAPENTGKTVKILILTPAAGGPFKHPHCQLVFPVFSDIGCQVEVCRVKGIFAVAHITSVQPYRKSTFHTLKGNADFVSLHIFRNRKISDIACHRIEFHRNFSRNCILLSIPGILHIGILGCIITLHLDMGRHPDIIPRSTVILLFFKSVDCQCHIFCITELPDSIQFPIKTAFPGIPLIFRQITVMIRMYRKTVLFKNLRIFYNIKIKFHQNYLSFLKKWSR